MRDVFLGIGRLGIRFGCIDSSFRARIGASLPCYAALLMELGGASQEINEDGNSGDGEQCGEWIEMGLPHAEEEVESGGDGDGGG